MYTEWALPHLPLHLHLSKRFVADIIPKCRFAVGKLEAFLVAVDRHSILNQSPQVCS